MLELISVSLIWGLSFVLIKGKLSGVDPFFIAFARMSIACLVFMPFIRKKYFKYLSKEILIIGTVQYGLMYILYINSYQYLQASQIALMTIFTPLFVHLFGEFFKRKFSLLSLFIVIINVLSALLIINIQVASEIKGIILMQLSNICFAFGQIYYKFKVSPRLPEGTKQYQLYSVIYLMAAITTLPFFIISKGSSFTFSLESSQLLSLLYLGAIPSGLGLYLWNKGAVKVKHSFLAIANNLKIPAALFFSVVLLAEKVNISAIILFLFIFSLSSIWLNTQKGYNFFQKYFRIKKLTH